MRTMTNSSSSASDFSRAARVIDEHFDEIFKIYEARLNETHNLLVIGGGSSRDKLKAQARSVLGRAAAELRGQASSSASVEEEVYQNLEAAKAPLIQHPDESFRAGMELVDAALKTVARRLDLSGCSPEEIFGISCAVQEGVMDHVARVSMAAYVDYLLAKIHETQVEERRRFSRELHDRVAHSMALVNQNLELREAFKEKNPQQAEKKLEQAGEYAREAISTARDISMELRRSSAGESLAVSLDGLMRASIPPGVEFEVSFEGDEEHLPDHTREQLYMVLREGVRNAIAHSDGASIRVGIEVSSEEIIASVSDDGAGFDTSGDREGVGLKSMRERISLLDGSFDLSSIPGSGTKAEARVPLKRRKR